MRNTLLDDLLLTFTAKEWQEWLLFLEAGYFNRREELRGLARYLHRCHVAKPSVPRREEAFHAMHPGRVYDDQQLRLGMSRLKKLAEEFLAVSRFRANALEAGLSVLQEMRERRLDKHQQSALQQVERRLEGYSFRDSEYFRLGRRLAEEEYLREAGQRRIGPVNLQSLSDALDLSYATEKLRQACFLLSHQSVFRTDYRFGLLPAVVQLVEEQEWREHPGVAVYYSAYQALQHPEEERFFQEFYTALKKEEHLFPEEEKRALYLLAINFCIRQYNLGRRNLMPQQFELYRWGLEKGFLLANGVLSPFTYQNITILALVLGEEQWLEGFLEQYRPALAPEKRDTVHAFCQACLEVQRRQFGRALELLQRAEYGDLLLNLAAKTVQIKVYYEMGALQLLESHLSAMEGFIRRKKGLSYHRESYLHTVRFTRRLLELRPYDRAGRRKLREQIEQTGSVAEKDWLLKQLS